jgi:hypothetical protein
MLHLLILLLVTVNMYKYFRKWMNANIICLTYRHSSGVICLQAASLRYHTDLCVRNYQHKLKFYIFLTFSHMYMCSV